MRSTVEVVRSRGRQTEQGVHVRRVVHGQEERVAREGGKGPAQQEMDEQAVAAARDRSG